MDINMWDERHTSDTNQGDSTSTFKCPNIFLKYAMGNVDELK